MSRLICADFDEFEEALYGVEGHYVLRSRQQRDWRLRDQMREQLKLHGVVAPSSNYTLFTRISATG